MPGRTHAYSGDLEDPAVDDSDLRTHPVVESVFPRGDRSRCGRFLGRAAPEPGPRPSRCENARSVAEARRPPGPTGLFTITGGKFTTYRAMAEDLVDRIADVSGVARPCRTRSIALDCMVRAGAPCAAAAEVARLLSPRAGARLVQRYGDDWPEAACIISEDQPLGEPVVDSLPVLNVELELARSREMAIHR